MADTILSSFAGANGTYNDIPTALTSETVTVLLVDGLTMTYAADKATWADDSYLTYTITITNGAAYPYVAPTVATDAFNAAVVTLVENSVTVDGQPFAGYTFTDGVLSLTIPDVEVSSSAVITFQMQKAA